MTEDVHDLVLALKPVLERFRGAGGDPRWLEPVLVDPDYSRAAMGLMAGRCGSLEGYVNDGLGSESEGRRLRDVLVET